jgi:hypothetical protein
MPVSAVLVYLLLAGGVAFCLVVLFGPLVAAGVLLAAAAAFAVLGLTGVHRYPPTDEG